MDKFFLTAGIPASSPALYRQIRFSAGDPAALLEFPDPGLVIREARPTPYRARPGAERVSTTLLILRDIENERAAASATVDFVASPADFTPEGGLSGDLCDLSSLFTGIFKKGASVLLGLVIDARLLHGKDAFKLFS